MLLSTDLRWLSVSLILLCFACGQLRAQGNVVSAKQGTTMLTQMDNRGAFGKVSYLLSVPPNDSLGVDFPVGGQIEHLYGAGLWFGALVDTTSGGNGPRIEAVSTAYEGYGGGAPFFEFYPGTSAADSIWKVYGAGAPKPAGWDAYWGSSLPYHPVADQNFYCVYADDHVQLPAHIPMGLKVIQSSYTWDDPSSQGIQIISYRIISMGARSLDSCYVGFFADPDVGPVCVPDYNLHNASDYMGSPSCGFTLGHDSGSTPFGVSPLFAPSASRFTFLRSTVETEPAVDRLRYLQISSGMISPSEFPQFGDTRFVIARGPYTLYPADTLQFAVAFVCGQDLGGLSTAALRARDLYNSVITSVQETDGLPRGFQMFQNYPNPFNPTTEIRFDLPEPGNVSLVIYDVLGRQVVELAHGYREAGYHNATWNASGQASGVYFARLTVTNAGGATAFTNVNKLMLVR